MSRGSSGDPRGAGQENTTSYEQVEEVKKDEGETVHREEEEEVRKQPPSSSSIAPTQQEDDDDDEKTREEQLEGEVVRSAVEIQEDSTELPDRQTRTSFHQEPPLEENRPEENYPEPPVEKNQPEENHPEPPSPPRSADPELPANRTNAPPSPSPPAAVCPSGSRAPPAGSPQRRHASSSSSPLRRSGIPSPLDKGLSCSAPCCSLLLLHPFLLPVFPRPSPSLAPPCLRLLSTGPPPLCQISRLPLFEFIKPS